VTAITTATDAAQGTTRRSFIKLSAATAAALGTYGVLAWAPRAEGRDHTIDLFITAGETTMVDGRRVPVRTYSPVEDGVSLPGPLVLVAERDRLRIAITNTLDTPHGFAIDGFADSGPIAPGATTALDLVAPPAGTYLYQDPVDAPFNRLLGLHGAWTSLASIPGCSETRQQIPIRAIVTSGLPGEHEQDSGDEQQRIRAGRACHDKVPVHDGAEEGGDAHERAED